MEPGLRCTIFPATVAVVLGPVQPHYFWEPNSHGPRNRRASSAFLALFPGIVSFVTSRAAFQAVNVCAGRSKFPVFSFRKGNLKFRMQPLFSSSSANCVLFPSLLFCPFCSLFWYCSINSHNNPVKVALAFSHKVPHIVFFSSLASIRTFLALHFDGPALTFRNYSTRAEKKTYII